MHRRRLFRATMGVVLMVAAAVAVVAVAGLVDELRARPLTPEERDEFVERHISERWRILPAKRIFPEKVAYKALGSVDLKARRVGIAPPSSCRAAVFRDIARVLDAAECLTFLRATYVDQSATFAATVGIAVFPDLESRRRAKIPPDTEDGLRPVAFPRTVTEGFADAGRQRSEAREAGPYLVLTTAGYADGRTREAMPGDQEPHSELWPTAQNISSQIAGLLIRPPELPPCTNGRKTC